MRSSYLTIVVCTLAALPTFAQERPRFFDNFDTSGGVQVYNPKFVPVGAKNKPALTAKNSAKNKKFVQPTAMVRPAKQSPMTQMGVSEGLADREPVGPSSFNNNFKLAPGSSSLKGFTTGDAMVDLYIVDSSRKYGIDPLLIYSQMHQESSFKLRATSPKGASGLMQLMPATARRMGVANIYDPKQNIDGGVKYMRMLLDMFGQDVNLALAGYNAGEGSVDKYKGVPPFSETQNYVKKIVSNYGKTYHPVLPPEDAKLAFHLVSDEDQTSAEGL